MALGRGSIWATLEIAATSDRSAIRRAYSSKLKRTSPEDDPEAFQQLREAYEFALRMAEFEAQRQAEGAESEPERETEVPPPPGLMFESDLAWELEPETEVVTFTRGGWWSDPVPVAPPAGAPDARTADPQPQIPGVSAQEVAEFQAAFARLSELIEASPQDESAIIQAFWAIMRLPALDAVMLRAQAESWIASMIFDRAPRADALVDPSIAGFKWTDDRIGSGGSPAAAMLARSRAISVIRQAVRRGSQHHAAYRALVDKPVGWRHWRNRFELGLRERVERFLAAAPEHALQDYVDPDAHAWWRERLSRPAALIENLAMGAVAFVLLWIVSQGSFLFDPERGLDGLAAVAAVGVAALGAWAASGKLRNAMDERWPYDRPLWLSFGWLAPALAGLVVAAAAPPSPATLAVIAAAELAAFLWATACAASPRGSHPQAQLWLIWLNVPVRLSVAAATLLALLPLVPFSVAILEEMPRRVWAQTLLAIVGAAFAFGVGRRELHGLWASARPSVRLGVLAAVAATTALAPLALWATAPGHQFVAAGAVLVAVLLMTHLVLLPHAEGLGARATIVRLGWLPAFFLYAVLGISTNQGNPGLLFTGMWLLAIAATGIVGAIHEEMDGLRSSRAYR